MSTTPATTSDYRGILRIDAAPSGKRFQGVWLERGADKWILDYRARELWRGFVDAEVIVTGSCYQPEGQAILATHLRVDRLRFATAPKMSVPYFEIGPAQKLTGTFVVHTAPPGSKLAGTSEIAFHADDGTSYAIAGGETPTAGPTAILARVLEANRAYSSTSSSPQIWIVSLTPSDEITTPPPAPCK